MKRVWCPALAAVIFLLAQTAGAGTAPAANTGNNIAGAASPIIVGAAIGETGFMAPWDATSAAGAALAIKKINARGGVLRRPLQLVIRDTKSDLAQGATAGVELLDKGASVMMVSCDFDYGAGAAIKAMAKNVLALSTCAASTKYGPQGIGPLAFTMATSAPNFAGAISQWAFEKKKIRSVYLLLDSTLDVEKQYCDAYEKIWTKLAGKGAVLGKDTFQQNDPSVAAQITRIKSLPTQPEAIALCSYMPGAAKAIRQIRAAGLKMPILLGDDGDGSFWLKAVPNASNIYFATYGSIFGDDSRPAVNAFFRELKRAGQPAQSSHALTGYALIQAFALAAKKAGTLDGTKLAKAMETFRNVPTLAGPTTFTAKNHIQFHRSALIMKVERGRDSAIGLVKPKFVPIP